MKGMVSDMNHKQKHFLALILVLSVACASVGTGDKVVVRAEDALSNSLAVYGNAMSWHFQHSTTESPAIYRIFEDFRVKFPIAWQTLDNAKRSYQLNKANGSASIDAALSALSALIATVTPFISGGK
jgi:hypothetical protein